MLAYLSDEWVEALDRALGGVVPPEGAPPIVVQFVVGPTSGDRDEGAHDEAAAEPTAAYHLELTPTGVRARPGRAEQPGVTFTQTRAVALALARGERSAQAAVLTGEVRMTGRGADLLAWGRVLGEDLAASLREVHRRTDLGRAAPA